jgi:glycosyltransferase involved in cell wall biosynthesis
MQPVGHESSGARPWAEILGSFSDVATQSARLDRRWQTGYHLVFDVSVIIPSFNRLWSLPKAVESCRTSGCKSQIIVVDDGSTDGTWDWLQRQKDVVAIRQDNWGKDWAVNEGFAVARGEFVRFLDSDDWLMPAANEQQLAIGRSQQADVVVAGHRFYDEESTTERDSPWTKCDDFIAQQLGECDSSHYSAYLFRRTFIEHTPHRQEFGFRDDRMFVIEVAVNKPRVAVFNSLALVHRHHAQQRLQFAKGMGAVVTNWQHVNVYKKALALLEARGELTRRRMKAATNVLWPLAHWIAYSDIDEACEVASWIYRLDDKFIPPEKGLLGMLYGRLGFRRVEQLLRMRRFFVTPSR